MRSDSQVVRWVGTTFAVIAAMLTAGMLAAALGQVSSSRSYQVVIGGESVRCRATAARAKRHFC
jgi:hypothetical protein